jgi:hypothetical protein
MRRRENTNQDNRALDRDSIARDSIARDSKYHSRNVTTTVNSWYVLRDSAAKTVIQTAVEKRVWNRTSSSAVVLLSVTTVALQVAVLARN